VRDVLQGCESKYCHHEGQYQEQFHVVKAGSHGLDQN